MTSSVIVNPSPAQLHISAHGADWLWTVLSLFIITLFFTLFWSFVQPRGQRAFHHIGVFVLVIGIIGYFTMAADLGQKAITAEFSRSHTAPITRGIFYARWIMYAINLTLIVLAVLLATGATLSELLITGGMNIAWVLLLLFGAFTRSTYKWGYYVLSVFALFYVLFHVVGFSMRSTVLGSRRAHVGGAGYITFFWLMYPLIWAFSEGGNVISPTGEAVWYGIVDLLTMPVFVITHLWTVRSFDYNSLGFTSGKNTDFSGGRVPVAAVTGAPREKAAQPAGSVV